MNADRKQWNLPSRGVAAIILAIVIILSSVAVTGIFVDMWRQPHIAGGYHIEDPLVNEHFTFTPTSVSVSSNPSNMLVLYSKDGMTFYGKGPSESVRVTKDLEADTVALGLNMNNVFKYDYGSAMVRVTFDLGDGDSCSALIEPGRYNVSIMFTSEIDGVERIMPLDFFHDRNNHLDALFQVRDGTFLVEIDGVESVYEMASSAEVQPRLAAVEFSERTNFPLLTPVTVTNLQIGNGTPWHYRDPLHKTILPDGKDFAFSLHMHADRAYPSQMYAMANLTEEYGLGGSYDAWWAGSYGQYGMESPEYVAALHALQDAGWDIGVHAASFSTMTREQVISALENITAEFGPIPEWSDHGTVKQDLSQQGTNQSSPYYTEDLIKAIGAAWWYNGSHSNSPYYDLNRDGMDYDVKGYGDIPTFRVSEGYGHDLFMERGRQADTDSYLRAWAYDRSTFVMHDYFAYYFYVTNSTGTYSVFSPHDDIGYYPWSQLNPKIVFVNDEWTALPRFVAMLEMMQKYDVWFPTVREAYDRSVLVQKVEVIETSTEVRIINHNAEAVDGLTLFTRGEPSYTLEGSGLTLLAEKGTVDSWAFVLDLQPGETIVLQKKAVSGTSTEALEQGIETLALTVPQMAMREELF